jgi:hypothetical protein
LVLNVLFIIVQTFITKVMTNSILEITENEYLIKLNRSNFNLSFIRSLLKIVEVANPSEDGYFTTDRHIAQNQSYSSEPDYYSSLEEK